VLQLASCSARLLKATYISFPRARISTPNNVRSSKKKINLKKTRIILACTGKHCRRSQKRTTLLSANESTLRALALELISPHTKHDHTYTRLIKEKSSHAYDPVHPDLFILAQI